MSRRGRHAEASDLADALRRSIVGEVLEGNATRAQYSSDASNYRVPPSVVVLPRHTDDLLAIGEISRASGVPVTMRGGGTSVAGNAIGPGIVVDTSRHLDKVLAIDPESRTATVQPGTVLTTLQRQAARHGLRFGPDPSTQSRATIGGMIGNNACGPRAVAFGRTSDNVTALDVVDGTGRRFLACAGDDAVPGLRRFTDRNLALLRTEFGRFRRQASGYSLEHLLPENGRDLAKTLVGSEGTLAMVLEATVRLVPVPRAPVLVVLGYPDMATAAEAVPALLEHSPLAIEGFDSRLIQTVREQARSTHVPELPPGGGWLFVEVSGETLAEARTRAMRLAASADTSSVRVIDPGPEAAALWRIREDGAGLGGRVPGNRQAWPGWEDAAVPPRRLGAYLRDFEALMLHHGVVGLPYGHFGDGCIHVRLDLPLDRDGEALRAFTADAANLVASHGGSLSGEHGDGRARSELLASMYSPAAIAAFAEFKRLLDPAGLMNPGVLVLPDAVDENLRRPRALPLLASSGFAFSRDQGDFTTAVHRCVGVGKCRADGHGSGAFMCPSFAATTNENDVTRGRARTLQEMANGTLVSGGWRSTEVHEALDLCLGCKACARDCPAGVDMAQYKAEVLHRAYGGRLRPVTHYSLGWLPRWARLASLAPRLVNAVLQSPLSAVALRIGGMDGRRRIPRFSEVPFRHAGRDSRPGTREATGIRPIVLWADSFSSAFSPSVPRAAVTLLEDCGYHVIAPEREACCGLTWISTGQLTAARRRLRSLLDVLAPYADAGIDIVGVEPSCTAVLRSDLEELLPDDARAARVAARVHTLAEVLTAARNMGWRLPDLGDVEAVVQPHCHQYSVTGFDADRSLLNDAGARITELAGCCGLAGDFGMTKGHYETSVAVAETAMLPALRNAPPGSILLADGFSCRTQADQLADVRGTTLPELLAERVLARRARP